MKFAPFVSLHNHTELGSPLDGMNDVDMLFDQAKELNHSAIAITDHGTLTAHYDCWKASERTGVKFIPGIEAYFANDLSEKKGNEEELRATIVKLEKKIQDLTSKINDLVNQLNNYKKKHEDSKSKPGENEETLGNKFAPFIKLKRENAILKAQLKDLMMTQKKMLGSAKRVNMSHGRGR